MLEAVIIIACVAAASAVRLATFEIAARSGRYADPIGSVYSQWFDERIPLLHASTAARN